MAEETKPGPNCPFYGYRLLLTRPGRNGTVVVALTRVASHGNHCGARLGEYTPCECESQGQPIDHRSCAWLRSMTYAAI